MTLDQLANVVVEYKGRRFSIHSSIGGRYYCDFFDGVTRLHTTYLTVEAAISGMLNEIDQADRMARR